MQRIKLGENIDARKRVHFTTVQDINWDNRIDESALVVTARLIKPDLTDPVAGGVITQPDAANALGSCVYTPSTAEINQLGVYSIVLKAAGMEERDQEYFEVVAYDPFDADLGIPNLAAAVALINQDLDAPISTRAVPANVPSAIAVAAQVDATLTASHGANSWQQGNVTVPPTAAAIAAAVWTLARAGNQPAGSFGEEIDAKISSAGGGGGGVVNAADVVTALLAAILDPNAPVNARTFQQIMNLLASRNHGDAVGQDGPLTSYTKPNDGTMPARGHAIEATVIAGARTVSKLDGNP